MSREDEPLRVLVMLILNAVGELTVFHSPAKSSIVVDPVVMNPVDVIIPSFEVPCVIVWRRVNVFAERQASTNVPASGGSENERTVPFGVRLSVVWFAPETVERRDVGEA